MIAACPKCSARYRIAKERVRPEGVRLRCSRCEAVFRVRSPESHPQSAQPSPPEPAPEVQVPAASAGPSQTPPPPQAPPVAQPVVPTVESRSAEPTGFEPMEGSESDRERLVLVADPMIDEGKATAATLAAWGLEPILVHDGVEAILTIQRKLPRAVVIDAALPRMYGFQICELLKRNESLRHTKVVLIGAIHDRTRYRRNPTDLYGADAYLERPQLPDALWPMLRGFGLPLVGGAPASDPLPPRTETAPLHRDRAPVGSAPQASAAEPAGPIANEPSPQPVPGATPEERVPAAEPMAFRASQPSASAGPAAVDPVLDAEVAKAERLARIVVSDIVLYNQEKFDAAVRGGDVVTAMAADLDEGRTLFAQRIDARVRESRDFLTEELLRVAEMRRSQ